MTEEGSVNTDQTPTNVAGDVAQPEQEKDPEPSNDDRDSQLERLLFESKKNKERAQKAEAAHRDSKKKLDSLQATQLQEQGKYKELYEAEKHRYEGLQKSVLERELENSVKLHAKDAGCVDVGVLYKVGSKELLQFDEDTGQVHGAELFVEDAKQKFPYLFSKGKPPVINPAAPQGVAAQKEAPSLAEQLKSKEGFSAALAQAYKNSGG
jgi:hypothetical protein